VGAADWLTTTPADARRGGAATRTGARTDAHARRVRLDPTALALVASRVPGRHALVSVTF
jgi:hypothetical protein